MCVGTDRGAGGRSIYGAVDARGVDANAAARCVDAFISPTQSNVSPRLFSPGQMIEKKLTDVFDLFAFSFLFFPSLSFSFLFFGWWDWPQRFAFERGRWRRRWRWWRRELCPWRFAKGRRVWLRRVSSQDTTLHYLPLFLSFFSLFLSPRFRCVCPEPVLVNHNCSFCEAP